jgi:hypothetical protein
MAGKKLDFEIPLQSNFNTDEPSSLPSSPTAADADLLMELPFVTPSYSLAIQSKRAIMVRNALVASKCTYAIAFLCVCVHLSLAVVSVTHKGVLLVLAPFC